MKRIFPTLRFRNMIRLSVLALAACMVLSSESARAQYPVYDTTAFIHATLLNLQAQNSALLPTVDSQAFSVAVGDVDNDGINDLVVCFRQSNLVSIYHGLTSCGSLSLTGSFSSPVTYSTAAGPASVRIADLNNDGLPEIIMACRKAASIEILRNTNTTAGTISFTNGATGINSSTRLGNNSGVEEAIVADIDGDGKPDLIGAVSAAFVAPFPGGNPDTVVVYRNLLTGVGQPFSTTTSFARNVFPAGNGPHSVSAADFDHDGKPDLVVSNDTSLTVCVLQNTSTSGSITFRPKFDLTIGSGTYPEQVVTGDLDGDGRADIIFCDASHNQLRVFRNGTTGTSSILTSSSFSNTASLNFTTGTTGAAYPIGLALGDLNGDGRPDVVVANINENTISVFRNTSTVSGGISFAPKIDSATGANPIGVAIADLDGNNGVPDIVVTDFNWSGISSLTLYRNNPLPDTVTIHARVGGVITPGLDSVCIGSIGSALHLTGGMPSASVGHATLIWSATNGHVSIADSTITGVSAGYDTIVATVVSLCDTNKTYFTVRVLPSNITTPITGASSVCLGDTIMQNDATPFGTWSVTPGTGTATIDVNGVVTGTAAGTAMVSYSISGACVTGASIQTHAISINTLPVLSPISGPTFVAPPATITLSDAAGAGNWAATNGHATVTPTTGVSSVTVHGISNGIDTIYYSQTNSCGTDSVRTIINICPPPVPGSITGTSPVCVGDTQTFHNPTGDLGGTWVSTNPLFASINSSTGFATAAGSGTTTIRYVLNTACGSDSAAFTLVVNTVPSAATITAPASPFCQGTTHTFTPSVLGGAWTSMNPDPTTGVTIVSGTGSATAGASADTATIVYTLTNSCGSTPTTYFLTVSPTPNAGTISGADSVCSGTSTTLTIGASVGVITWSTNPVTGAAATVDATGVVTAGAAAGSVIIVATATNSCGTDTSNHPIGVILSPNAGTISSTAASVCRTGTLAMTITGNSATGTWGSDNPGVATITNPAGVVTGVAAGSANITYVVTTLSCGSASATPYPITVIDTPVVPAITGSHTICYGTTATLHDAYAGGGTTWGFIGTGGTHIHYVSGTGTLTPTITGFAIGVDTLKFSATNACGTTVVRFVDTVKAQPKAGTIVGATDICAGTTTTLTDFGGVFTTSTWTIAGGTSVTEVSHDSTHFVLQAGPPPGGASLILFTATNSCGTKDTTFTINVDTFLTLTPVIALHDTICLGQVDSAFASGGSNAGSTWDTYPAGVVNITSSDSSYAAYTATDTGTYYMVYSATNGCGTAYDTSAALYVHPATPTAGVIFGYDTACVLTTSQLGDTTAGAAGVWSSSDTAIAKVSATGLVTAIAPGTATIMYTVHGYCVDSTASASFVVIAAPALTSPLTATTCDSAAFTYTAIANPASSTFTWVRPAVTGVSNTADSGVTATINENLNDTTNAPVTVLYNFMISAAGCSTPATVIVTVEPTPLLTSAHFDTVCSGVPFTYIQQTNVTGATVNYGWTRPSVAGITPATNHGTGNISETLVNGGLTALSATYYDTLKIAGTGCSSIDSIKLRLSPAAPAPQITTFPPHDLCSRTYDMNFGAATIPPAGVTYSWSSTGGSVVFATGSTQQYALVNFAVPGTNIVYLNSSLAGFDCPTKDSFIVNVSTSVSDSPEVIYFNNDFVCLRNDEDTYQWGYDDVSTVDSTILTGETNQHYSNANPDLTHKYYWVITTRQGCMQKSYFNDPLAVQNVNNVSVGELNVYPNPTSQNINVEIKSSTFGGNYSVDIRNMLGQKVSEDQLLDHKASINVADLANGIYFVDCYRDGVKVATTRFVKN